MLTPEQINELKLTKYPAPILRQLTQPIDKLDTWVKQLAIKMIELMYLHNGVGLAGNQAGVPLQIFVANPTAERGNELVLINPKIVDAEGWQEAEEGCLSLPEIYGTIRRQQRVIVEATNLSGKQIELEATDLMARIIQHEIDHLTGKLIYQRMSTVGKLAARRQLKNLEQQINN